MTKYNIKTEGMGCAHCIKKVTGAMQKLNAEIEHIELNDITVISDKKESELASAIEELGFKVISVEAASAEVR